MTAQRDKMLQRILNLRQKAEDDGASEAEMQTAFTMAQKLMDAYNIEEAELALAEAEGRIVLEVVKKVVDTSCLVKKQRHKIILCLNGIAALTQSKVVYNSYTGDITFVGHKPDVELANYLVAVCREALEREYDAYRRKTPAVGYGAKAAFQVAMASRINTRLWNMKNDREAAQQKEKEAALKAIENSSTTSSTALVVCEIAEQKRKEVNELYTKSFPRLRSGGGFSYGRNYSAGSAGRAAGDRVNLGRAVSGATQKALA